MAERFYANSPLAPGEVLLQGPEAHHLASVMRAKPGDTVILFAGDGLEYPATVISVDRKSITLSLGEGQSPARDLPFHLEVASAIPKGDRGDFLVEKLTELGVARLVPLKTERSVVHPRPDRLIRTVIEACKQCGRNRLMEIAPITDWNAYCRAADRTSERLLAHPAFPPSSGFAGEELGVRADLSRNAILAIGPEGGFSDNEVTTAIAAGWKAVSMGPRILRVETAAIALAACEIGRRNP